MSLIAPTTAAFFTEWLITQRNASPRTPPHIATRSSCCCGWANT
jgi:hypothetical protein